MLLFGVKRGESWQLFNLSQAAEIIIEKDKVKLVYPNHRTITLEGEERTQRL
jgi:hypothetical protein